MRSIPAVALNDGLHIPQVGFGLYKVDPGQTTEAVRTALEIGYRHFDTAQMYKNEHGVGQAVRDIGIDRADVFLIDWPLPTLYGGDFVSTWRTLEEFKSDGRARSIGVSNFQIAHLERLAAETDTVPAVNQVEAHPYFANAEVCPYNHEHGIATEAWSPLAR